MLFLGALAEVSQFKNLKKPKSIEQNDWVMKKHFKNFILRADELGHVWLNTFSIRILFRNKYAQFLTSLIEKPVIKTTNNNINNISYAQDGNADQSKLF